MRYPTIFILFLMALVSGCASKPALYPNEKYERVGSDQANSDINTCTEKAESFLKSSKGKQILKGAGKGAAVGGVMGAAAGLFTGDLLGSALFGGTVGAAGGAAGGAISPDQLKRKFVNRCLQKKGYEVVGWN